VATTTQKPRAANGRKGATATPSKAGRSAKIVDAQNEGSLETHSLVREGHTTGPFDEQLIRERAYAIWIEEGQPEGRDLEHWTRARVELKGKVA
jgi:hypothetical protein